MTITAAVLALAAQTAAAQDNALAESKSWDNWYIGINGGAGAKTTHYKVLENLNPMAGVRVGRWFTPAFGLMVEDQVGFSSKPGEPTGTIVNANTLSFGTTINFSNWFGNYKGEPRRFEVIGVPSLGWTHLFGNKCNFPKNINAFEAKLAADFAVNLGRQKAFQIYVEPALAYNIYERGAEHFNMDINRSVFQLTAGLIYRFKNTNGTHNFKYAEPVSSQDDLDRIAQLTRDYEALRAENASLKAEAARLSRDLNQAKTNARAVVAEEPAKRETILPGIFFQVAKSSIQQNQKGNVEAIAKYMTQNPDARITIKGYASPEGNARLNQKLSEARAKAVADMLVKKYGIAADRIFTEGCGTTSELYSERNLNRVAVSVSK